ETSSLQALHPLDDACRGPALFNGNAHHLATARLDRFATHDAVGGPVSALHQDVRLDEPDDVGRRVLVEDDNGVHAGECRKDFRAFAFGIEWTRRTLDG